MTGVDAVGAFVGGQRLYATGDPLDQGMEWAKTLPRCCLQSNSTSIMLRYGRTQFKLAEFSPESSSDFDSDDRPVVVLINGLALWSIAWTKLEHALTAKDSCKALLTYDRYGRGLSDVAVDPQTSQPVPHSPDLYAQQLEELLFGVRLRCGRPLRQARLVLVGASMGGMIATKYAAMCPEMVSRLVLLAPAALKPPRPILAPDVALLRVWGIGHAAFALIGRAAMLRQLRAKQLRDDVPDLCETDPELLRDLMDALTWQITRKPGFLWDFYRDLTQMPWGGLQQEAEAIGSRCSFPVDLVWGSEDPTVPPEYAHEWRTRIPRASLTVIDGAAHSPYLTSEHAERIARVVLGAAGR